MNQSLNAQLSELCEELNGICQKTIQELEDSIDELSPPNINPELRVSLIEQKVVLKKVHSMVGSIYFDFISNRIGHSAFSLLFVILEELQSKPFEKNPQKDVLLEKFGKLLNLVSNLANVNDRASRNQKKDSIAILTITIRPCKTYPVVFKLDCSEESPVKSVDCTDEDSSLLQSLVEKNPGGNRSDFYPKTQMAVIDHFLGLGFESLSITSAEVNDSFKLRKIQVYLKTPTE